MQESVDVVTTRGVVPLTLSQSLTKPNTPQMASLYRSFWGDIMGLAEWSQAPEEGNAHLFQLHHISMSEVEIVASGPVPHAFKMPKVEVTVTLNTKCPKERAGPYAALYGTLPLTIELLYSPVGPTAHILHPPKEHHHCEDSGCCSGDHDHDHKEVCQTASCSGCAPSPAPGMDPQQPVTAVEIRPRVISQCYSSVLQESGILSASVELMDPERPDGYIIEFNDIQTSLDTMMYLLTHDTTPTDPEDPVLNMPNAHEIIQHWSGPHSSNGTFKMPFPWEEFLALGDGKGAEGGELVLNHAQQKVLLDVRDDLAKSTLMSEVATHKNLLRRQQALVDATTLFEPSVFSKVPFTTSEAACNDAEACALEKLPLLQAESPFSSNWPWQAVFDPVVFERLQPLLEAVRDGQLTEPQYAKAVVEAFSELRVSETEGVFSFPCFNHDFCALFVKELKHYESNTNLPKFRPNSMNQYGIIINEMGLQPFITALCRVFFWPLGCDAVPQWCGNGTLDHHHSFVVEYGEGRDVFLDMHIDDSETTFSVNLCDTFDGSSLVICGMVGEADRRKLNMEYHHALGRLLVHSGSRRHGAKPIKSGERYNLIVWGRSSLYREGKPPHGDDCSCCQRHPQEEQPDQVCMSLTWDDDYEDQQKRFSSSE